MKATKVFIGLVDIASFIDDWAEGFKQNHFKTLKGSILFQAPIQNSQLDFIIQKTQDKIGYFKPGRVSIIVKPWWNKKVKEYYFEKALRECDTFLFLWNSFENDFSDYKYLKKKGKKIITLFVGSDIRWPYAMKQDFKENGLPIAEDYYYDHADYSVKDLERCLRYLRVAEKYSDVILAHPNYMQLALRDYHNLSIPIITDHIVHKPEQRKIPLLVHAPTSKIKGTKFIEEVIDCLSKEGIPFEYKRIENMPRKEALQVYADADIILDQLLLPGGGKLAHECLAMGKIVCTLMGYNSYDQKRPDNCPMIDVTPDTLYDVLKSLIPDHDARIKLAKQGRPFVEKYHNPKIIAKQVMDLLYNSSKQPSDFKPTFFRERFIPESEEAIKMCNKWNEMVKDCDWYKNQIKKGNRAGLEF